MDDSVGVEPCQQPPWLQPLVKGQSKGKSKAKDNLALALGLASGLGSVPLLHHHFWTQPPWLG